jgi:tight adherence protein B
MPAPSSEEFSRVLREVRFGFPMEQALTNLAERMENDDLHIVVTAIIINAQVGGNLSTVLESTIDTIRDRMQLSSEVRSLTSYARYVGNFLSFLPFVAGIVIFLLTPDYFQSVLNSFLVQVIFAAALIGIVIGNIWIRRIATIKV